MKKLALTFIFTFLLFFLIFSYNAKSAQLEVVEIINYDTNEKIVFAGKITVKAPYDIVCRWNNASDNWKDCEVVIEVNNSDTKNDLILKGDSFIAKFLKDVKDFSVETTYSYITYEEPILNRTCYEEEKSKYDFEEFSRLIENKSICYYNYTRKSFYNFQPITKLDKIYKNSVIGIKLKFKSPIAIETEQYLKNHFNFTLLSDYNITLDPEISQCAVLDQAGATYYLTANIIDSTSTYCMNIQANNIILDCLGNTIDGTDTSSTYGIYIYRTSAQNTNITIRNCKLTDWSYGIYLRYANNNTIINSTFNSNYNGIALYYNSNNTIINSTFNSNSYYGIYLYSSSYNKIINSTFNSNSYYGIYLSSSSNNTIINSTLQENSYYDFYISVSSDSHCNNYLSNVIGSNNKPIEYYNYSVTLSNKVLSELILCNADYSDIKNITIDASPSKTNNAILVFRTDYSNLTQINSSFNYYGIHLSSSNNNKIINSTFNSNSHYGIYFISSSNNQIINSTFYSNFYGIQLSSSNYNQIIDSISSLNQYGIYISSGSYNNITASSFHSNTNYDYYLISADSTNTFTNTNFTEARKIYFSDTTSWFNYRNESNGMWLKNKVSAAAIITRTLNSWKQTNITWTEQASATVTAQYNLTGLLPSTDYYIQNSSGTYQVQTDSEGSLSFLTQLTTTARVISVYTIVADTQAPQYSLNSTNSTLAGSAVSHNLFWEDNVGLSYAIFSFDNCTQNFQNISTIQLTGKQAWSNFTVVINDTVGCEIRWKVYANDTSNNWNVSEIFSYVTTKKEEIIVKKRREFNIWFFLLFRFLF
ncbi:MAG: NosD domain-containing protein [Candidatus Aenigmatarchaeota archaeon]